MGKTSPSFALIACLVAFGCASSEAPKPAGNAAETASVASGSSTAPTTSATTGPVPEGVASAQKLRDDGKAADAAREFERIYTLSPRGDLAREALWNAADAYFAAQRYYHALELLDKLLVEYPQTPHYLQAIEEQFQIGKLFIEEKATKPTFFLDIEMANREYGIEVLEKFVKTHERDANADAALFLVGEAHEKAGEPELAIEVWQRVMEEYPLRPLARLAEYRIALAFLSLSYGPDYDKRPLYTALKRLRAYVRKYPTGDNVADAEAKLAKLEEELAQQELNTAKEYSRASHVPGHGFAALKALFTGEGSDVRYVSARIYLNSIRREYPKTKAAAEAAKLAAEWPDPPLPPAPDPDKDKDKDKDRERDQEADREMRQAEKEQK